MLSGNTALAASLVFNDQEAQALQNYANVVSIKRLGYNDHGPVHMRKTAQNALIMFDILHEAGIEDENIGTAEDSKVAVLISSLLHDIGMSVGRENHELLGVVFAMPIIERTLTEIYAGDVEKKTIVQSLIVEGIAGHMATQDIHSLEAGLVSIGDGCDMEKGRARIIFLLSHAPKVGDIHKYSAQSIQKVEIIKGEEKPIRIIVEMTESVVELYGKVTGEEMRRYL